MGVTVQAARKLHLTVYGHPEPGGSKRAVTHPRSGRAMIIDANRKAKPWQQQVIGVARDELGFQDAFTGPVGVTVDFYVSRPKGHYGTGRNADQLRPSAPVYPTSKPDASKLWRSTEDALTAAGVWRDDAQVVTQLVRKQYGLPERCEITIVDMP